MLKTATYTRIQTVLQGLSRTVDVESIASNGVLHTIVSNNTLWITPKMKVEIGGIEYTVKSVTPNVEFVVTHPTDDPTGATEVIIPLPEFRHGTPQVTNGEITKDKRQEWEKFPMIWMRDIQFADTDEDPFSTIEREADCEFHLLTSSNYTEWKTADHDANAIQAMLNLAEKLEWLFNNSGKYIANDSVKFNYSDNGVANWGRYNQDNGNVKQIFSVNVDGVIIKTRIPFLKTHCN